MSEEKISFLPPEALKAEFVISALSETTDWGLLATGIPDAHKHTRGDGITVAVLDTGCPNHLDLNANLLPGINCSGTGDVSDKQGHGCIGGDDIIWSSEHGVISIKDFYNQVSPDNIIISGKDMSSVKMIDTSGINTIARFPNGTMGFSTIKAVHELDYCGDVFKVKTRNAEISLTPWHPVYIITSRRGNDKSIIKKRADELKNGDVICTSENFEDNLPYISVPFGPQYCCQYCGHTPNRGAGVRNSCRKCNKINWKIENAQSIILDEKFAKWLGLVISDGHIMRSSASVVFSGNDENLIKEFETLTNDIFGLTCHRYAMRGKCFDTRVHSTKLISLMFHSFGLSGGAKSLTVKLPKLIEKSRLSVIGAFVAGVIEGDGHIDKNWRIRIASGSRDFSYALKNLLRMRGIRSFVSLITKKTQFNTGWDEADIPEHFHIRISPHQSILNHLTIKHGDKEIVPTPLTSEAIVSVEKSYFKGKMYDLTVNGTNNYIANTIIVSNTHVSGIIAALENGVGVVGVAPEAKILSIKVLDDSGHSGFSQIADGIRAAIAAKVDIINMSLGAPTTPPDDFYTAIKEAYDAGIIMVAAAGNDAGAVNWPARYDEVIAVSAIDNQGNLANFSSHGDQIDFGAPGVNIYSTYLNNKYAILNGTSQAAPFIAGVCALLLSWNRKNPNLPQIKNMNDMLIALGKFTDVNGRLTDGKFGLGIPKFANAIMDEIPEVATPAIVDSEKPF